MKGHDVLLKLYSEVVDILFGAVDHKSCVDIVIHCFWNAICILFTEVCSIKESPTIYPRESFFLLAWSFDSDGVHCEGDYGSSVKSLDIWDPY